MTDKGIDSIYDGVEALMKAKAWDFLDEHLRTLIQRIWRTDIDELVTYLTATLPAKRHLPSRENYLRTCKHVFPDEKVWKGLE